MCIPYVLYYMGGWIIDNLQIDNQQIDNRQIDNQQIDTRAAALHPNLMISVLSLWGTTLPNYFSYSGIYITLIT